MRQVAVVGGGIVGVCCALHLRRDGAAVTIFDPGPEERGASFGNVGSVSPGSVLPLAGAGILQQVTHAAFAPDGAMKLGALPAALAAPWLLAVLRQSRDAAVARSTRALASLLRFSFEAFEDILGRAAYARLFRQEGQLYVYEDEAQFAKAEAGLEARRRFGCYFDVLDGRQLLDVEPNLAGGFARGVQFREAGHVVDPAELLRVLTRQFVAAGGELRQQQVKRLGRPGRPQITTEDGATHMFDQVVIAAGAWSPALAAMIGVRLPIESLRGYVVDFDTSPLRRPTFFPAQKIFATPMAFGMRVGGIADLMGLTRKPDWRRAEVVTAQARRLVKGLDQEPSRRWMGHRPTTPDSLPVISRAPSAPGFLLAAGHGQLGLMAAATTGRMIADLALDRPSGIDHAPYRADRF